MSRRSNTERSEVILMDPDKSLATTPQQNGVGIILEMYTSTGSPLLTWFNLDYDTDK